MAGPSVRDNRYVLARVRGRGFEPQLQDGSVVCAERGRAPTAGAYVLAVRGGVRLLGRYEVRGGSAVLSTGEPGRRPIRVAPGGAEVVGVVICKFVDLVAS